MARELKIGHHHLKIFADAEALSEAAAELFSDSAQQAIASHGQFYVSLAGGGTPQQLYRRLAEPPWRDTIDWSQVQFFFGDERVVPPSDPQSNFRMVDESLFQPLSIAPAQQHPMPTDCEALQDCAHRYRGELERVPLVVGLPSFDLCLLGMGEDGHTASLFPDTEAIKETRRWVVAVHVSKLDSWRLSLTLPVLSNARCVVMLVCGVGKAKTLRQVMREPQLRLPVQALLPAAGLLWYVDEEAAAEL